MGAKLAHFIFMGSFFILVKFLYSTFSCDKLVRSRQRWVWHEGLVTCDDLSTLLFACLWACSSRTALLFGSPLQLLPHTVMAKAVLAWQSMVDFYQHSHSSGLCSSASLDNHVMVFFTETDRPNWLQWHKLAAVAVLAWQQLSIDGHWPLECL